MPVFQRIHEMIRKSEKAKREVLENREKRTYNAQKSSAEKSTLIVSYLIDESALTPTETPLELDDATFDDKFIASIMVSGKKVPLSKQSAEQLLNEAQALGVLPEDFDKTVPILQKTLGELSWGASKRPVAERSEIYTWAGAVKEGYPKEVRLATLDKDSDCFYEPDTGYLVLVNLRDRSQNQRIKVSDLLKTHFEAGLFAVIDISHASLSWYSTPDYLALKNYHGAILDPYNKECERWLYLSDEVRIMQYNLDRKKALLADAKLAKRIDDNPGLLPFAWKTNIKQVISGLTENSNGNGSNKRTVMHIVLDEDFKKGRLKRHKDDYLCSDKKTSNWSAPNSSLTRDSFKEAVTCKACLSIANRLVESS